LRWLVDGTSYFQMQPGEGGSLGLHRVDYKTGKSTLFYDAAKLEAALIAAGLKADDAKKLAGQTGFEFNKAQTAAILNSNNDLYLYDFANNSAKALDKQCGGRNGSRFFAGRQNGQLRARQ
jgi:hypothetical protein